MRVGVGLWTFQSTHDAPVNLAAAYAALPDQARDIEAMGYDSMWFAEHRFWYDGWCPQPMVAMGAVVAATERLRVGSAMMLVAQHDPVRFARTAQTLHEMSDGRLDLGIGLGHRDAEFDGLGLRRDRRGRMMDAALEVLDPLGIPTWIGGMAGPALERGAVRGHGFVLPQTLYPAEITAHVDTIRSAATAAGAQPGPIGILKDCWVTGGAPELDATVEARIRRHYREEAGAWWILKGTGNGFQQPALLERQLQRVYDAAIIGPADHVAGELETLRSVGVDLVVLRFWFDITAGPEAMASMRALAEHALDGEGRLR